MKIFALFLGTLFLKAKGSEQPAVIAGYTPPSLVSLVKKNLPAYLEFEPGKNILLGHALVRLSREIVRCLDGAAPMAELLADVRGSTASFRPTDIYPVANPIIQRQILDQPAFLDQRVSTATVKDVLSDSRRLPTLLWLNWRKWEQQSHYLQAMYSNPQIAEAKPRLDSVLSALLTTVRLHLEAGPGTMVECLWHQFRELLDRFRCWGDIPTEALELLIQEGNEIFYGKCTRIPFAVRTKEDRIQRRFGWTGFNIDSLAQVWPRLAILLIPGVGEELADAVAVLPAIDPSPQSIAWLDGGVVVAASLPFVYHFPMDLLCPLHDSDWKGEKESLDKLLACQALVKATRIRDVLNRCQKFVSKWDWRLVCLPSEFSTCLGDLPTAKAACGHVGHEACRDEHHGRSLAAKSVTVLQSDLHELLSPELRSNALSKCTFVPMASSFHQPCPLTCGGDRSSITFLMPPRAFPLVPSSSSSSSLSNDSAQLKPVASSEVEREYGIEGLGKDIRERTPSVIAFFRDRGIEPFIPSLLVDLSCPVTSVKSFVENPRGWLMLSFPLGLHSSKLVRIIQQYYTDGATGPGRFLYDLMPFVQDLSVSLYQIVPSEWTPLTT